MLEHRDDLDVDLTQDRLAVPALGQQATEPDRDESDDAPDHDPRQRDHATSHGHRVPRPDEVITHPSSAPAECAPSRCRQLLARWPLVAQPGPATEWRRRIRV